MLPMPPSLSRTDNGRRRWLCLHILGAAILDGIDDDTQIIGVTITTVNPAGEIVQHSGGLREPRIRRHLIPPDIAGDLDELVGRLVDLDDLPPAPDSPGWLP